MVEKFGRPHSIPNPLRGCNPDLVQCSNTPVLHHSVWPDSRMNLLPLRGSFHLSLLTNHLSRSLVTPSSPSEVWKERSLSSSELLKRRSSAKIKASATAENCYTGSRNTLESCPRWASWVTTRRRCLKRRDLLLPLLKPQITIRKDLLFASVREIFLSAALCPL